MVRLPSVHLHTLPHKFTKKWTPQWTCCFIWGYTFIWCVDMHIRGQTDLGIHRPRSYALRCADRLARLHWVLDYLSIFFSFHWAYIQSLGYNQCCRYRMCTAKRAQHLLMSVVDCFSLLFVNAEFVLMMSFFLVLGCRYYIKILLRLFVNEDSCPVNIFHLILVDNVQIALYIRLLIKNIEQSWRLALSKLKFFNHKFEVMVEVKYRDILKIGYVQGAFKSLCSISAWFITIWVWLHVVMCMKLPVPFRPQKIRI